MNERRGDPAEEGLPPVSCIALSSVYTCRYPALSRQFVTWI
jgi:hypothetical protein